MTKKILSKATFLVLGGVPLVFGLATSTSTPAASKVYSLSQNFQTKLSKDFKNSSWSILQNVTMKTPASLFEDSRGNLWALANGSKLRKYNYTAKKWEEDTTSQITDGNNGFIFEDSRGNLWAAGNKTKLEKYDYAQKEWTYDATSKITQGSGSKIYEDLNGNLWLLGFGAGLQKYDYAQNEWVVEAAHITNGLGAAILEDSYGTLWLMAENKLQKYNNETKTWAQDLTSNVKKTVSKSSVLFEDSRGNLWASGYGTPLQKYNWQTKKWVDDASSAIKVGFMTQIFEDAHGNLWSISSSSKLQKYDYNAQKWINNGPPALINGTGFRHYEDSYGNLWILGLGIKLQKYDFDTNEWMSDKTVSITSGINGSLLQDSKGTLWLAGGDQKIERLIARDNSNPDNQKIKNFNISIKTRLNTNSQIAVLINGFREYKSNNFTHLQYRQKGALDWKNVKSKIIILDTADYEFKWVIGDWETSVGARPENFVVKSDGTVVLASEVKKEVDTSKLSSDSFEFIFDTINKKTIRVKNSVSLPPQIEPRYYVDQKGTKKKAPADDNDYKVEAPKNLKASDVVYIKFFIKDTQKDKYKFPLIFSNTPLQKEVPKTEVKTSDLKRISFFFSKFGSNKQKILFRNSFALPSQVEPRYFVDRNGARGRTPANDSDYKIKVPEDLNVGDIVYIKFFIKATQKDEYKFPLAFVNTPIKKEVGKIQVGWSDLNPYQKLTSVDFDLILHPNDKKEIKIQKNSYLSYISVIPQVELRYFVNHKGAKGEASKNDSDYKVDAPKDLVAGDVVYIKLFIKANLKSLYKFPNSFSNTPIKKVVKKNLVTTTRLSINNFLVAISSDNQTQKKIKMANDLPIQVEARYFVDRKGAMGKASTNDSDYKAQVPTNLNVGDVVYIKFFIKASAINWFEFPSSFINAPIKIDILKTEFKRYLLMSWSFQIVANTGLKKALKIKDGIEMPSQLEIKYFVDRKGAAGKASTNDSDYQTKLPTDLNVGDIVYIKFVIKSEFINSFKFPQERFTNPIRIEIVKTSVDTTNLVKSSFKINGKDNGEFSISLKDDINLPLEVEIRYYVDSGGKLWSSPRNNDDYKLTEPKNLKVGDVVYIKFFIKNESSSAFIIPLNIINPFSIRIPKIIVDVSKLFSWSFEIIPGANNKKQLKIRDGVTIPEQIEIKFWVDKNGARGSHSTNLGDYKTDFPTELEGNDVIYINFVIKLKDRRNYQFPRNFNDYPIFLPVTKFSVAKHSLNPDSFVIVDNSKDAFKIQVKDGIKLPSQVKVGYYVDKQGALGKPPANDSDYKFMPPTNLTTGDVVYVKFFIINNYKSVYKLPDSLANNSIALVTPKKSAIIKNNNNNNNGTSNVKKILIGVGSAAGTVLFGVLAFFLVRWRRNKS